jgi:transcriptional regulator with XRE-family HTH domain
MAKKQPNPIDVHVGQRVRLRRTILGISQEKLGDSLGITFQQIQKYEKGTNRISASRLQHIARTLSVPVPYFFEDQPPDQTGSTGTEADHHHEMEFLTSPDAFRLNTAFPRIKDTKVRRAVIDLVRVLGKEQVAEERNPSEHVAPAHDDQAS